MININDYNKDDIIAACLIEAANAMSKSASKTFVYFTSRDKLTADKLTCKKVEDEYWLTTDDLVKQLSGSYEWGTCDSDNKVVYSKKPHLFKPYYIYRTSEKVNIEKNHANGYDYISIVNKNNCKFTLLYAMESPKDIASALKYKLVEIAPRLSHLTLYRFINPNYNYKYHDGYKNLKEAAIKFIDDALLWESGVKITINNNQATIHNLDKVNEALKKYILIKTKKVYDCYKPSGQHHTKIYAYSTVEKEPEWVEEEIKSIEDVLKAAGYTCKYNEETKISMDEVIDIIKSVRLPEGITINKIPKYITKPHSKDIYDESTIIGSFVPDECKSFKAEIKGKDLSDDSVYERILRKYETECERCVKSINSKISKYNVMICIDYEHHDLLLIHKSLYRDLYIR